ncbi:MAG: hypothetical protein R3C24_16330 [Cyanobacteriota/Melainabacteria group bacterium]
MKIRSKLSITFLTVSLASIATVCALIVFLLVYFLCRTLWGRSWKRWHPGKSNVLHVFNAWQDQVNLIRLRTSVREAFCTFKC